MNIGPHPVSVLASTLEGDIQSLDKGLTVKPVEHLMTAEFHICRQGRKTGWQVLATIYGDFVVQHHQTATLPAANLDCGKNAYKVNEILEAMINKGYI